MIRALHRRLGSGPNGTITGEGRPQKGSVLVTGKFVGSLGSLMAAIAETEPHYIRCVKPNEEQLPMLFQVCDQVADVSISKR